MDFRDQLKQIEEMNRLGDRAKTNILAPTPPKVKQQPTGKIYYFTSIPREEVDKVVHITMIIYNGDCFQMGTDFIPTEEQRNAIFSYLYTKIYDLVIFPNMDKYSTADKGQIDTFISLVKGDAQ